MKSALIIIPIRKQLDPGKLFQSVAALFTNVFQLLPAVENEVCPVLLTCANDAFPVCLTKEELAKLNRAIANERGKKPDRRSEQMKKNPCRRISDKASEASCSAHRVKNHLRQIPFR